MADNITMGKNPNEFKSTHIYTFIFIEIYVFNVIKCKTYNRTTIQQIHSIFTVFTTNS